MKQPLVREVSLLRDPKSVERRVIHGLLGPSVGHCLEVGCGEGRLTAELASVSQALFGLDPDRGSIGLARSLLSGEAQFILGSGDCLPIADNRVDAVVFTLSLHHHPDPGAALSEAARVAGQGGRILVLEPEAGAPANRLYRLIKDEDQAYGRAEAAVAGCGLMIAGQGSYRTVLRFEDFDEMVGYLFGYYDREPDAETVEAMARLPGVDPGAKPLEVVDGARYWLLEPAARGPGQLP